MASVTTDSVASVAIIDDHPIVRVAVAELLVRVPDLELVASAASVPLAISVSTRIDVALLDLRLQDDLTVEQNVSVLHSIGAKVLVFTSGESVSLLRRAAQTGALGVVRKSEEPAALLSAVRAAARGDVAAGAEWAALIPGEPIVESAHLTPREREVLARYASGLRADAVAEELFITRLTVLEHIKNIRRKYLQANRAAPTKVHLFQRAQEDGIIGDEE